MPRAGRFHNFRFFLTFQIGWCLISFAALRFFQTVSFLRLYLLTYIGFLTAFEVTSPATANAAEPWWCRLRWIQILGLVVLLYLQWIEIF